MNGGNNNAAMILPEQLIEPCDTVGVLDVFHSQRGQIFHQLVFQFVAVNQKQNGGFVRLRRFKKQFGSF